ncbi:MAG: organomercurial lyase, partial [Chloroflexota bacterium]
MTQHITHGKLHATILSYIIEHGFAPNTSELSDLLTVSETDIETALQALQDYHGVVLHPNSSRIWVVHPFSLAPTNFTVRTADKEYWGNCAWCSLGVAALLKQDCTITTVLGADRQQVEIHVKEGELVE